MGGLPCQLCLQPRGHLSRASKPDFARLGCAPGQMRRSCPRHGHWRAGSGRARALLIGPAACTCLPAGGRRRRPCIFCSLPKPPTLCHLVRRPAAAPRPTAACRPLPQECRAALQPPASAQGARHQPAAPAGAARAALLCLRYRQRPQLMHILSCLVPRLTHALLVLSHAHLYMRSAHGAYAAGLRASTRVSWATRAACESRLPPARQRTHAHRAPARRRRCTARPSSTPRAWAWREWPETGTAS